MKREKKSYIQAVALLPSLVFLGSHTCKVYNTSKAKEWGPTTINEVRGSHQMNKSRLLPHFPLFSLIKHTQHTLELSLSLFAPCPRSIPGSRVQNTCYDWNLEMHNGSRMKVASGKRYGTAFPIRPNLQDWEIRNRFLEKKKKKSISVWWRY